MEEKSVKDGESPPTCSPKLPKTASELFPTRPLQTFPSCRPSPGHLTGLSSLERARSGCPPIKIEAITPQCRASPVPEARTCICAPPARTINAPRNAGHSAPGATENGACSAKAARVRTKKVGWGGAVNLEQGKENCHVNNDCQESQQLEGQIFRPRCSPEPFGERMRKIQIDQNWKIERCTCPSFGGIDENDSKEIRPPMSSLNMQRSHNRCCCLNSLS